MSLKIIHRNKLFSWNELQEFYLALDFPQQLEGKKTISYPAENHFLSSLFLVRGFCQKLLLSPYHSDYSEQQNNHFIESINSSYSDNICIAIATSGTQSMPKIALISFKNISSHCHSFQQLIPLDKSSIWLNCMPLTHVAGIMIIYRCLFNNATMLVNDDFLSDGFNAKQIHNEIEHYKVTHISLVPRMLAQLLDVSICAPKSLKYVLIGGDKLSRELYQLAIKAKWPIYISYGMTEASSTIAIGKSPDKLELLPGFEVKIGKKKELKLKSDMLVSHYAGGKKLTTHGWFETSDIAKSHSQELDSIFLNILGRKDQLIISGGKNISPKYIEELILSSASVREFISDLVISKQNHSQWGDTIVATFVGDELKLKKWLKKNIKSCYRPRIFIQVDKIPRTSLGKAIRL